MGKFDVRLRGTDSSGRGIWATDHMWNWWERVCRRLGFRPVITQGAFMTRAGGGAKASAGVHDLGGTFDLRVWNLTPDQIEQVIRTCRQMGAAAWLRNEAHGGFKDPHIHLVLGSDQPLSPGARQQWIDYQRGLDGLANRGRDYHWRPDPLVLEPPKPKREPVRVGFANLCFSKGHDDEFLSYLAGRADVLTLVEAIRKDGTPVPVALRLNPLGWDVAHDKSSAARAGSAVAWKATMFKNRKARRRLIANAVPGAKGMRNRFATVVPLAPKGTREWIRFAAAHSSPERHAEKNRQLETKQLRKIRRARRLIKNARGVVQKKLLAPIAFGIDANEPIDTIAKRLHLKAVGKGIVGILVAPKRIEVVDVEVDTVPKQRGWTDHPVIFATIKRK